MALRTLSRWSIAIVVSCYATGARAWIFPEHMEITRFAYERDLPNEARAEIDRVVQVARAAGLELCSEVPPLEQYSHAELTCVPYSALPALAGDHANDVLDLAKRLSPQSVTEPPPSALVIAHSWQTATPRTRTEVSQAAAVLKLVAEHWSSYLTSSAPAEIQRLYRSRAWQTDSWQPPGTNGNAQRTFTRELDIALQATDPDYRTRSGETRAHFQDSLTPIPELLEQLVSRGNVDNALAQVLAHHIRSLQLASRHYRNAKARQAGWTEALLEHALALHFLQDAYASGHMGTEHRVPVDMEKARRHDFLNRTGLNVQRAVLGARCENITAGGRNAADPSEPTRAGCWVGFGDAYLDGYNSRIVADAVARVQMQFAMALGSAPEPSEDLSGWLEGICLKADSANSREMEEKGNEFRMMPVNKEQEATEDTPLVRFEGEGLSHVHRVSFRREAGTVRCEYRGTAEKPQNVKMHCQVDTASETPLLFSLGPQEPIRVRVSVDSREFDPQIAIRKCDHDDCRLPTKVTSNSDVSPFEVKASVVFTIEPDKDPDAIYELVVGNDGRTPQPTGDRYRIAMSVEPPQPEAKGDTRQDRCESLRREADLLDPAPTWTQTNEERKRRAAWGDDMRCKWAGYVVQSARDAIRKVQCVDARQLEANFKPPLISASGSTSGAIADMRIEQLLGNPLEPCTQSAIWRLHSHPFCSASTRGNAFAFGRPDASLWRPLIAIWPTPMGDITLIEGKDAFGMGPAVEVVFGVGPAVQLEQPVNWAWAGYLGIGASYRINNLFPARENRSLAELNIAIEPVISTIPESRFLMAGFFEARFPVVPFVLAYFEGVTSWFEWGPLGFRYYYQWPNKLPGGKGKFGVGWDIEFLNFDLDRESARNREAGHLQDKEIRVRLGYFDENYLMGSTGDGHMLVLAVELAWGHSTYFADL